MSQQLLQQYGINDRNGFLKQGKRSNVFDTQWSPYLSAHTMLCKVLSSLEKVKELGYTYVIDQEDYHSKPEHHEIACEREWHESKGSRVNISFAKDGKTVLQLDVDVDNNPDYMDGIKTKDPKAQELIAIFTA